MAHLLSRTSSLRDDNLEVFARNDHRLVAGGIEASDQIDDVASERFATGLLKRLKRLKYRPIVGSEDVEEVLR